MSDSIFDYWSSKWKGLQENFEDKRSLNEDPEGVLDGMQSLKIRGKAPPPTADFRQLLRYGNVGRSVDLPQPPAIGEVSAPVSLIDISGPDEYAQMVTVTLDYPPGIFSPGTLQDPFSVGLGSTGGEIRAEVQYGIGGFQSRAFVDFCRGVSFSVPASFLRVNAVRLRLGASGISPPLLSVGAHVGFHSISESATPPTLTDVVPDTIVSGGFALKNLPAFSAKMLVFVAGATGVSNLPPAAGNITLQFNTRSGALVGSVRIPFDRLYTPVQIPAHTTQVRVHNGAAVTIRASYQYLLSL